MLATLFHVWFTGQYLQKHNSKNKYIEMLCMVQLFGCGLFERTHFWFSYHCLFYASDKNDKNSFLGINFYIFKFKADHCDSRPFKMLEQVLHFISHVVHLLITAFTDQRMRHEMNYSSSHLVLQISWKPECFFTIFFLEAQLHQGGKSISETSWEKHHFILNFLLLQTLLKVGLSFGGTFVFLFSKNRFLHDRNVRITVK